MISRTLFFVTLVAPLSVFGFSVALFQQVPTLQKTAPSCEGVDIELPNFDELFEEIKTVSPLAKNLLEGNSEKGLDGISDNGKKCCFMEQSYVYIRVLL
jgi:hypothetical protein